MLDFGFFACSENDADDIEPIGGVSQVKDSAIHPRRAGDLSLLSQVNGGDWRGKPVGRARFDFDETYNVSFVERDDVNFAGHLCAARVSANRRFKIGDNEPKAFFHQKFTRDFFAQNSDARRFGRGRDFAVIIDG